MDQKLLAEKCDFDHFGASFSPEIPKDRKPDFSGGQQQSMNM